MSVVANLASVLQRQGYEANAGCAVGVLDGQNQIHCVTRGLACRESQREVQRDSLFRTCSLTKQFTCTLVMSAAHQGLLQLTDHPDKFLPELHGLDRQLTIEHLCVNQSGLRDAYVLAMLGGGRPESRFSCQERAAIASLTQIHDTAPGVEFRYSNTNYFLLGRILERVHDRDLAQLFSQELFVPARMHGAYAAMDTAVELRDGTRGYEVLDGAVTPANTQVVWGGDACIAASLEDLLAWQRFCRSSSHPCARAARSLTDPLAPSLCPADYRRGQRLFVHRGRRLVAHTGGLRGWRSAMLSLSDDALAVVVLFNHMADPEACALALADAMTQVNSDTSRASAASQPPSVSEDQRFSKGRDFPASGRYRCGPIGVEVDDEGLVFTGPLGRSKPYVLFQDADGGAYVRCERAIDYAPPGRIELRCVRDGLVVNHPMVRDLHYTAELAA